MVVFYYMHSPRETQLDVFRRSIRLARRVNLPIVVHTREADEDCQRVLIAVQDGMRPADVAPYLSHRVGVAVGGSTEWKEAQLDRRVWRASWLHVLRVNTARRIRLCHWAGADSFDGSSASRFAVTLPALDSARRQPSLWSAP